MPSFCRAPLQWFDPIAGPPSNPCPVDQVSTTLRNPWTQPAPESVPCPCCAYFRNARTLVMEIHAGFPGVLTEATLTACGTSYRLPLPSLTGGERYQVEHLNVSGCLQPILLSFLVAGSHSVADALLVMP